MIDQTGSSRLLGGPDVYWLPAAVFILHVVEELPNFPAWATRHFGVTTNAFYVYSHVPLLAIVVVASWMSATGGATEWLILAMTIQWTLFTNGVFHLITTIAFREYSPGVVTGTILFLPATVFLLERTLAVRMLSPGQVGASILLGTLLGVLIVASLWLRMNLDWRLRRNESVVTKLGYSGTNR